MEEAEYRQHLKDDGYSDPVLVEWEAGLINETHTHDFSSSLLILSGEMTVETVDETKTCRPGQSFSAEAGIVHTETVGPEGIRFLVGRK